MDSRKSTKRKAVFENVINKYAKIEFVDILQYLKRKGHCIDTQCKKQRTCNCIVHEEKYICDIYECNGNINRDRFILI